MRNRLFCNPARRPQASSREILLSPARFVMHRLVWALSVMVTLGLLFFAVRVRAQEGFQPPSPEELKMTSEPLAPDVPAIILYRQVDRDDNGRIPHEVNYFRVKILTEEGRDQANIEIPFFKQSENIVHLKARTIKPDGAIVNFDGQVFERPIAKARGAQFMAKALVLPNVQVGDIIEYSYTIDLKETYFYESWILNSDLFTKRARFSLYPDMFMAIRYTWQGLPPGSQPKRVSDSDHTIRMEASNIPAFQKEEFMPPEEEVKSRVDFAYDFDARDADTYWKKIGMGRNEQLEKFIGKRQAMEPVVAQIVSPADLPETKLRKIYDRVQHLRNTSFELSKTEQEEKRSKDNIPKNVETVWKRGYGDGVQLTWLFLALVRAAGLEAYGCWVSSRNRYFFSPKAMQSQKLDANVVLVKVDGKDLYFDPGAAFAPSGMLAWYETGTPGMRLDKDGGTWITTTLPSSSESRIERNAKLKLSDAGELEGALTVTHTGLEAMYRRIEFRNSDDAARKKFLENQLKEQVPAAAEVELTNHPDWIGSETPLVAEFHIKVPGWFASAGRRAVMPVGLFTVAEKHMFEHANRVHPVYFQYPIGRLDDVTIDLPAGWQVASLPPAQNRDEQAISYALKAENENRVLHVVRKLNIDIFLLETKYYPSLRKFFQIVRSGDEGQVILQPGPAATSN